MFDRAFTSPFERCRWHWNLTLKAAVCWGCIPAQCATQQPDSSCLCRRDILEKVLEQFLHWYFFTSEWVWRWALRLDLSAKALLQCGQEKGFSPGGWGDKTEQVSIQMPPRNIASVKASRGITKTCQVKFFFFGLAMSVQCFTLRPAERGYTSWANSERTGGSEYWGPPWLREKWHCPWHAKAVPEIMNHTLHNFDTNCFALLQSFHKPRQISKE